MSTFRLAQRHGSQYQCGSNDLMVWSVQRGWKRNPKKATDWRRYRSDTKNSHRLGSVGVSHLVVRVKLTAVDVVVVTPECGNQLAGVEAIHSHRASARHKHELGAAAAGHCELQPFTALVGHFPVIDLKRRTGRSIHCKCWNTTLNHYRV